jgi:hypothetical protein
MNIRYVVIVTKMQVLVNHKRYEQALIAKDRLYPVEVDSCSFSRAKYLHPIVPAI